MALKISKNSGLTDIVSTDASNPVTTTHQAAGSAQEVKLFLFNDETGKTYTGVTVAPTDASGSDEKAWVQLAPDVAGAPGTYGTAGASLALTVSAANTGVPFWVKVTTQALSASKTDLRLTTSGTWTTV